MRELLELFSVFARIGLFTFGGGYAMIPLIENACVGKRGWITEEEMTRLVVLAESTPGPVAINCATYVGLKKKGFAGAVAATTGVVLPSFVILLPGNQMGRERVSRDQDCGGHPDSRRGGQTDPENGKEAVPDRSSFRLVRRHAGDRRFCPADLHRRSDARGCSRGPARGSDPAPEKRQP